MEFVLGLFAGAAALGLTAWAVILIALAGVIVGVENERYSLSFGVLFVAAVIMIYLTGSTVSAVFSAVMAAPHIIVNVLLIYAGVGIAWGVVKWFFFLMRVRDVLVAFRENYQITTPLTDRQRREFTDYARNKIRYEYHQSLPPKANDNKSRILYWMIWWPFSMPWTLINEPVKRFFNFVYNRIAGFLQGMSDRLFKDIA